MHVPFKELAHDLVAGFKAAWMIVTLLDVACRLSNDKRIQSRPCTLLSILRSIEKNKALLQALEFNWLIPRLHSSMLL